ncbi:hypothetical protein ACFFX0_30675 [Citricoccus parietis]|uniref:Uncharacterized protein n=1 Tax=Citricoccus parietis TaxID=592307 RepID=A0ABV5G8N1_9MICC
MAGGWGTMTRAACRRPFRQKSVRPGSTPSCGCSQERTPLSKRPVLSSLPA